MNILLTGGASGLGLSIVEKLSADVNHQVYFTYNTNADAAQNLVEKYQNVKSISCDFQNVSDVDKLNLLIPTLNLDVLINNAYVGSAQGKHFHKTDYNDFVKSFEKNIVPIIKLSQTTIDGFRKKKFGKIINILSAYLVNLPPIGFSIYTSNKAYLQQLSKSWNAEYKRYNITSNCISPEFMQTNLANELDDRIIEQMRLEHPLKKFLTTDEVADSVLFLINSTQHINGLNLVINAAKSVI